jgi:hypothetical protein
MDHSERDLDARAISDALMASLAVLASTEQTKRTVPTGSPDFLRLAEEADEAARMVLRWAQYELSLATTAAREVAAGEMTGIPVESIPPRPLNRILADWREAEFRHARATPDTPEADAAAADVERLRLEYQRSAAVRTTD